MGTVESDCWNACALPLKVESTDGGRFISRSAALMASVAVPSATPGARLKLMVTAGNCP